MSSDSQVIDGVGAKTLASIPLEGPADHDSYRLAAWEVLFGIFAVFGWLSFFASGAVVSTAAARTALDTGKFDGILEMFRNIFVVATCYTITNVAFLSCLAAMAGQFSGRSRESSLTIHADRPDTPTFSEVVACYSSAAMRGFVIYLLITSGLLLVTTEAIASPDQAQYVRLAATVSVISFIAGYDTGVFRRAMDRVIALVSQAPSARPRGNEPIRCGDGEECQNFRPRQPR